jgi:hypothetical protein
MHARTSRLTFRTVGAEDGPRILDLYNSTLGERRTLAEWRWEFLSGPGGEFQGWVAEEGERFVAHWAVIPLPASSAGQPFLGGKGELAVTDPGQQGRGVFPRMFRHAMKDLESGPIRAVWSFPNEPLWKVQEWAGFRLVDRVRYILAVRRPGRVMRDLCSERFPFRVLGGLLSPMDGVVSALSGRRGRRYRDSEVEVAVEFDDRFDHLWRRLAGAVGTTLVRDRAFLRWRFGANPRHRYHVLLAREPGGTPLGYLVLTDRMRGGLRMGEVVDLLVDPAAPEALGALLQAARDEWSRRDVDLARLFVSSLGPLSEISARIGKRAGHRFTAPGAMFSVRGFPTESPGSPSGRDDWFVTAAFTEGIDY